MLGERASCMMASSVPQVYILGPQRYEPEIHTSNSLILTNMNYEKEEHGNTALKPKLLLAI